MTTYKPYTMRLGRVVRVPGYLVEYPADMGRFPVFTTSRDEAERLVNEANCNPKR